MLLFLILITFFLDFVLILFSENWCWLVLRLDQGLTLYTLRSKFEFSFVAPIHFLQKQWGEVDKISSKFILCDHVRNSHDHSVLQSIDITKRNLTLIILGAWRVKRVSHLSKELNFTLTLNTWGWCTWPKLCAYIKSNSTKSKVS